MGMFRPICSWYFYTLKIIQDDCFVMDDIIAAVCCFTCGQLRIFAGANAACPLGHKPKALHFYSYQ